MSRPFIKWVGGKAKLWPQLVHLLPSDVTKLRHVEPFIGGGAVFFASQPARACISDVNEDLIGVYRAVRDDLEQLLRYLTVLTDERLMAHDRAAHFYELRSDYNARNESNATMRAAWFIYLNKTCFNGLHRVNKTGAFNTPYGKYDEPLICDEPTLLAASSALRGIGITCCDRPRRLRLPRSAI